MVVFSYHGFNVACHLFGLMVLQYQYNIKQTRGENKEKYQSGDHKLIQYQILQTTIIRTVWETLRRITNEILVVKGLSRKCDGL